MNRGAALAEPTLSPEKERALIRAWQDNGDVAARDAVVRAYIRLCYKMAARYSRNPSHVEDLAQEGCWGLLKALDRFDDERGVKFSTYSRYWIQNFVASAASRTLGVLSVPPRAFIDARMGRIAEGDNDAAIAAVRPAIELDLQIGEDGGSSIGDALPCPRPDPEDAAAKTLGQEAMKALVDSALASLGERERAVLVQRRLADPPRTLEDISDDYGVTRERIRQIEVSALEKVRKYLEGRGFDPTVWFEE